MQAKRQNLFTRDDTIFGVCEAIGEDFHIPANILRLAMAPLLIWNPLATVCGYLAIGCLIALTRWIFPAPRGVASTAASAVEVPAVAGRTTKENEPELLIEEPELLPVAA